MSNGPTSPSLLLRSRTYLAKTGSSYLAFECFSAMNSIVNLNNLQCWKIKPCRGNPSSECTIIQLDFNDSVIRYFQPGSNRGTFGGLMRSCITVSVVITRQVPGITWRKPFFKDQTPALAARGVIQGTQGGNICLGQLVHHPNHERICVCTICRRF